MKKALYYRKNSKKGTFYMQQLIEVVKLVSEKYKEKVNVIICEDVLTLEYLYYINNEKDVYKTIEVKEKNGMLNIKVYPEKIVKNIEIEELEDIFEVLDKQISKNKPSIDEINNIKKKITEGTRIELLKMYDLNALQCGAKGTVKGIDDAGNIMMNWDNGSTIPLVIGTDDFKIISKESEKVAYNKKMDLEEYIQLFDKSFGTKIYCEFIHNKFVLLDKIFYDMGEDFYIPSEEHKTLRKKLSLLSDKFDEVFNYEQQQIFDKYLEIESEMNSDLNRQMLVFGFCLAFQELKELGVLLDINK